MNREVLKQIDCCHGCPLLQMQDGFADHWYWCPHFGDSPKTDWDTRNENKVKQILDGWFENCPTWRYLGE
jgi:hypothetical protein